nr:low affinity immunoglobulin epsilon Fc receptor [Aotus nancymaae]
MEEGQYSEIEELSRKKGCCRHWTQTVLLGLLTAALWAGLLTLLLLWHGDTTQNLKQLEERAARNVSQVSKYFERYQGDQMAQKSQATEISQSLEALRAEQQRMQFQDSELSSNLNGLQADLSRFKSQELNERHAASDLLGRLQEEVRRLQMELQVSRGSHYVAQACPEQSGGNRSWALLAAILCLMWSTFCSSNWAPEEPTNRNQGKDCVMMRGSGDWNDIYCDRKLGAWVCDRLATCAPPAREGSAESPEPDSEPGQDGRLPTPSAPPHP